MRLEYYKDKIHCFLMSMLKQIVCEISHKTFRHTIVHITQYHITQWGRTESKSALSFPKTHTHTHARYSLIAVSKIKAQGSWPHHQSHETLRRRCYPFHPRYTSFPHSLLTLYIPPNSTDPSTIKQQNDTWHMFMLRDRIPVRRGTQLNYEYEYHNE